MQLKEFLTQVVTTDSGFFELGVRNGTYSQEWYSWPNDLETIVSRANQAEGDVYFSSHLFSERDSHKEFVLPSRTIQQDLDNADISTIALQPSILVQTSPNRHQGFWIIAQDFDSLLSQEALSKKLAYSIPECDRSGWPLGHKVRVPGTKNYKYKQGPYDVSIQKASNKKYNIDDLEILPELGNNLTNQPYDLEFIERTPTPLSLGAYQLIEQVKDHLSAKVYAEYMQDGPTSDRSISLFSLMLQCFRAGLARDEVYWIAYHSPNNKFHADLRFNADRELAKDVLRAELAVNNTKVNIREQINDIRRKTKTLISERKRAIYDLVVQTMQQDGDFVHLVDDRRYYLPRDVGRPIEIEGNSEPLASLMDIKYSLNPTESEHQFVTRALISYSGTLPELGQAAVLSYYDPYSQQVLIHTGRKDVHVVNQDGITQVPNGMGGVMFPWGRVIEPFTPSYNSDLDWGSILFDVPNIINMTAAEARTTLKVYLLFSLLREAANSRPILAFIGQPGCLSGDTQVHTNTGVLTLRGLWERFIGPDKHKVTSIKNGEVVFAYIHDVIASGRKLTYTVEIADGTLIRATEDHLFLTPGGFVPLKQLKIGDVVVAGRGHLANPTLTMMDTASIISIAQYKYEDTYDIVMSDESAPNFVANNFVVHNSGKTTTARKLYALFYGKHMDVSGVTTPVNYDIATSSLPFYVLDNVDTWEKWLPDRLAQSAGKTDVIVRKLYTNNQIVRIKRQAMVAVTAHDPKFGRADVTDRMLIISLQRFSNAGLVFKDEGTLISQVIDNRNKLWGAIIQDLQRVLATPLPPSTDLQLRVQDFARLGEWIAIAIDEQEVFRSAIDSLRAAQRSFNLDEDHVLVSNVLRWLQKIKRPIKSRTQDELYTEVLSCVPGEDIKTFQIMYKNSSSFCRRLSNLQDTLSNTVFKVAVTMNAKGQREWLVTPASGEKDTENSNE